MRVEIICWNTKDKINICNNSGLFEQISESDDKNYFFHSNRGILKIIDTDKNNEDIYNYYLRNHNSFYVFIVSEINKDNIQLIDRVILDKNCIIICGKIELEDKNTEKLVNRITLLPQLYYSEEQINIKLFITVIENLINQNELKDYLIGSTLILGSKEEEEPLGIIPLTILKNFNYVKEIKDLELNIYSDVQQSIQELSYIKDPIMEYLPYHSMLKINQMINKEINGKIYYSLIIKQS